jgi:hypothetical protein
MATREAVMVIDNCNPSICTPRIAAALRAGTEFQFDPDQGFARSAVVRDRVILWEKIHEKVGFGWCNCHRCGGPFGLPGFGQVVGRKESICISGQSFRSSWKTWHARKRRWCRTENRAPGGAALRSGRDLLPLGPTVW